MATKLLTGTVKTIVVVDYDDVDKAVNKFFKLKGIDAKSECVCDNEWVNDSSHSFTVKPEPPSTPDKKGIEGGDCSYCLGVILNWMCVEGHIDAGEYLVDISW